MTNCGSSQGQREALHTHRSYCHISVAPTCSKTINRGFKASRHVDIKMAVRGNRTILRHRNEAALILFTINVLCDQRITNTFTFGELYGLFSYCCLYLILKLRFLT